MTGGHSTEHVPAHEARLLSRTRWRLVALSAASTLVVLVILGTVLYAVIARQLAADSEAQLRRRAEIIATIGTIDRIRAPFRDALTSVRDDLPLGIIIAPDAAAPGFLFGGPTSGTIAFVLGSDGLPVGLDALPFEIPAAMLEPLRGPDPEAVQAAIDAGRTTMRETEALGVPVRAYTAPLRLDPALVVQVVADRTTELRTLGVTLFVIVVGGLVALVVAAALGWFYAGRALEPIRESLRRQRRFAADASHELRTPLAVMRGSVEFLRDRGGTVASPPSSSSADVAAAIDDLETGLDRVTTLVDQLLVLARADADAMPLDLRATDLAEAAAQAVEALAPLAERHGVVIGLDIHPVTVEGDPERLRQLVILLLDNAIRHTPEGGACRVVVRRSGGEAILEVEDDGPGIRPADMPRVFDRFWRAADAPEGGSGLGLSIASWIVSVHHGRISAGDRAEGGARFIAVLPTV
jgi:signal transduction histidine kinase